MSITYPIKCDKLVTIARSLRRATANTSPSVFSSKDVAAYSDRAFRKRAVLQRDPSLTHFVNKRTSRSRRSLVAEIADMRDVDRTSSAYIRVWSTFAPKNSRTCDRRALISPPKSYSARRWFFRDDLKCTPERVDAPDLVLDVHQWSTYLQHGISSHCYSSRREEKYNVQASVSLATGATTRAAHCYRQCSANRASNIFYNTFVNPLPLRMRAYGSRWGWSFRVYCYRVCSVV